MVSFCLEVFNVGISSWVFLPDIWLYPDGFWLMFPHFQAQPTSEWWKIPKPTEQQLKCMPAEPQGCGAIKHKLMCLSRVDGRIGYAPHGLNVGGEPCVWCGGGSGASSSDEKFVSFFWFQDFWSILKMVTWISRVFFLEIYLAWTLGGLNQRSHGPLGHVPPIAMRFASPTTGWSTARARQREVLGWWQIGFN